MTARMAFLPMIAGAVALAISTIPTAADARGEERPWWEKSNCLGLKGVSWIECQKAISRNKRDRKAGRPASNQAWWEESKCLGLEGISWATCQKARSENKRDPGANANPWEKGKCLGLTGLSFVECHKERKRSKREDR
jgi:hypothetical protein